MASFVTVFKNAGAVDTWDHWFRWRSGGRLRDVTVSDTWLRVARALANASPAKGDYWTDRYVDAFSHWRLLPNPQCLRRAGTPLQAREPHVGAVVNLAAHVTPTPSGLSIDEESLRESAALAVRLVDDMLCAASGTRPLNAEIGIIGFGSTVSALARPYDRAPARALAKRSLCVVSAAAWETSARLAAERGRVADVDSGARSTLIERGVDSSTLDAVERHGLRFRRLTRLTLQPLLSRLAGVTDALQPAPSPSRARTVGPELKLRACLQPLIDEPIDLPLVVPLESDDDLDYCTRLARRLHMPMPFLDRGGVSSGSFPEERA